MCIGGGGRFRVHWSNETIMKLALNIGISHFIRILEKSQTKTRKNHSPMHSIANYIWSHRRRNDAHAQPNCWLTHFPEEVSSAEYELHISLKNVGLYAHWSKQKVIIGSQRHTICYGIQISSN